MDQNKQFDELPPECAAALEAALDSADAAHVHQCPRCQAILAQASALNHSIKAELVSRSESDFTRNVMTRLPAPALATTPSTGKGLIIAARPEPRRWIWGAAAVAAIVAVVVGVGIAGGYFKEPATESVAQASVAIERGALTDAKGRVVKRIEPGAKLTARERTVVAIQNDTLLRMEPGTAFEVGSESRPSVKLAAGDMYASAPDARDPLRVSLKNFDTDLHGGEFFVAQEGTTGSQAVVIVFSGMAQVRVDQDVLLPLNAGQVYYNVEQDGTAAGDTLRTEELAAMRQTLPNESEARKLYADRVKGFERELGQIRKKLASIDDNSPVREELQKRAGLVEQYLQEHRERLEAMGGVDRHRSVPYEQIQRGLRGRTDPVTWRM